MRRVGLLALGAVLLVQPAFAGTWIGHDAHSATFRPGASNGRKTQRYGTNGPVDVVCLKDDEEYWVQDVVPPAAEGGTWTPTLKWIATSTNTTTACVTVSNFVCLDNTVCKDEAVSADASAYTVVGLTLPGTADAEQTTAGAAFGLWNTTTDAVCTAGACQKQPVWFRYKLGTNGSCTATIDAAEEVCFLTTVAEYGE